MSDCYDKYSWKYEDYTKKSLFPNLLFSLGYTLYIDFDSAGKISLEEQRSVTSAITSGFRTAIMNWTASLNYNRSTLNPLIVRYIDDNIFVDGDKRIFNAPQVFTVNCPKDANFIIKIFLKNGEKFPDKDVIAKAQIQGRTIILNMHDFHLKYASGLFNVRDMEGNINIVPVIAHELGHSFGLEHTPDENSIMNASFNHIGSFPTKNDGKLFADILLKTLNPKSPGFFDPNDCSGLKVN